MAPGRSQPRMILVARSKLSGIRSMSGKWEGNGLTTNGLGYGKFEQRVEQWRKIEQVFSFAKVPVCAIYYGKVRKRSLKFEIGKPGKGVVSCLRKPREQLVGGMFSRGLFQNLHNFLPLDSIFLWMKSQLYCSKSSLLPRPRFGALCSMIFIHKNGLEDCCQWQKERVKWMRKKLHSEKPEKPLRS